MLPSTFAGWKSVVVMGIRICMVLHMAVLGYTMEFDMVCEECFYNISGEPLGSSFVGFSGSVPFL